MEPETQAVETTTQTAATEQVDVDYEAESLKLNTELAKVRAERDNYKRGMLKAKGKVTTDDTSEDELSLDERIERKVQEKLLESQEAKLVEAQTKIIKDASTKVKELTLALKNRAQITTASTSSDTSEAIPGDNFWSKDQLAEFKRRGVDPEKVKQNILKEKITK